MNEKLAPFAMAMSTCNNEEFLSDEGLEALHQAGVQAIELSFRAAQMDKIDLTAQVEKARAHGILVWSIHLPFDGLDIAALDEAFRRRTLNYHKDLITRAGAAGIHTAVVHACLEPVADADRAARMERSKESLCELAECAQASGVVVAVEDLPRSCLGNCSKEMLELLSADERLRLCFDTNHLLGEDIAHFLSFMNGKIRTVHISDYDFVDERHWLPGEGRIDWKALLKALEATGYTGPFLYEVGMEPPRLTDRTTPRTLDEFTRNYRRAVPGSNC
ncbi:MAG: sugar phosphate isomerase/epimerase family protein [Eubacteriales bacterium]|nr:sugar phosphate isomerase/epimerase [bacterium]MDY2792926.1 sugar phosphate isomerase/epimerase family protein [Eubacteriales bacterium]